MRKLPAVVRSCAGLSIVPLLALIPPATAAATSRTGCCGGAMDLSGDAYVYVAPGGKASDGTPVPTDFQTEIYGGELVVRTELEPGTYKIVIAASENSFSAPGKRLFSVDALSGGRGPTPADPKGDPGVRTTLARDVDLFKLAGGEGKPYLIQASVKHPGGMLRLVFHGKADNAKFSSIKILDANNIRRAWLLAEDVVEMFKLPDTPPVVPGPVLFKDADQPFDRRAADLVRRLTLREKIAQLQNTAPPIDRLGVPAYNYWSECLHGVARNGIATVFPQAIAMSATFDPAALRQVGDVIATEARAKFNQWQLEGGLDLFGGWNRGLTFWSPNINLFRDPRWGRGQETYGEDPFLSGTMAVQFIQGLQGDDPKYFKVVATAKHFAVHSGPEPLRHTYNAAPPIRDFYESYLPQFEMAVRQGKVYSIMGSYNRVYGTPACASDLLLKNILRRDWGFQGYVVSDCGAITDIWAHHNTQPDRSSAAAAAVLAGCDLECGYDYRALATAVDTNLIGEAAIDRALERVLLSRFKLGLFDPQDQVPYNAIRPAENDTPAHQALALKMARESIVLLKNDGALPLSATARKIAVVGPNAEGLLPLLGNYNGTPSAPVPVLQGIQNAFHGQIVYVRGCDNAPREGPWQLLPDVCLRPAGAADPSETGLRAQHFSNEDLAGQPLTTRTEKTIDFYEQVAWTSTGIPPAASSSRWTGEFVAPADGEYRLAAFGSSAYRFQVNGQSVTDQWRLGLNPAPDTGPNAAPSAAPGTPPALPGVIALRLKAGQAVPLTLECHQAAGMLNLQLVWNRGDLDLYAQAAQRVRDADAIVYVGGLDGHMEAEESDIRGAFLGFDNGDRTAIELPSCQDKMIQALVATGKPVVVVNMTGSAIAMPWQAQHVNAILQAWYPGQAGGTALADVLFGNYSPSGKLPITFYRATADLPAFANYAMKGRTYRYLPGAPLWPFGHGLSYTTFRYGSLLVDKPQAAPADTVTVSLDLTNIGPRAGDEVVQIYAKPAQPAPGDPLERLVGFQRVTLAPGQTARVEVKVPIALLRSWGVQQGAYFVPPGTWTLTAGSSSADLRQSRDITVK